MLLRIHNRLRYNFIKLLQFKYYFTYRFNKKSWVSWNKSNNLIISLTSYPKRFKSLKITLESLFNQSYKPDWIYLWLIKSEIYPSEIPEFLKDFEKRWLKIMFWEENYKPYNKLIYSLEKFPESIIITCDDDIIYPRNFIKWLIETYEKNKDCVIAYRWTDIKLINNTLLSPYNSWDDSEKISPSHYIFATWVWWVLYPPKCFHSSILDKELFKKLSPNNDDIWFKAMEILNWTKVKLVWSRSREFPTVFNSQLVWLWHSNVSLNHNDGQLKNVFDYFDLYNKLGK